MQVTYTLFFCRKLDFVHNTVGLSLSAMSVSLLYSDSMPVYCGGEIRIHIFQKSIKNTCK